MSGRRIDCKDEPSRCPEYESPTGCQKTTISSSKRFFRIRQGSLPSLPLFCAGRSIQRSDDTFFRHYVIAARTTRVESKIAALRVRRFREYGSPFSGRDEDQSAFWVKRCILPVNATSRRRVLLFGPRLNFRHLRRESDAPPNRDLLPSSVRQKARPPGIRRLFGQAHSRIHSYLQRRALDARRP